MKGKNPLSLVGVFLLLVVFPAVSWYYLDLGKNRRMDQLSQLKDIGPVPVFSWPANGSGPLKKEMISGKMLIACILPTGDQKLLADFGAQLSELHEQFDERNDLLFPIYVPHAPEGDSSLTAFAGKYGLKDPEQVFFIPVPADSVSAVAEAWKFPLNGIQPDHSPYLALCDVKGMIRRFFDLKKPDEIGQLAEVTAMILPLKKDKELIFRRERER
ncbi:MAG: hypothetical protein H6562_08100 [Lewinellaceae bacterium]|nr:hypothetical protein [Lewinella sp.]MCB9278860.1 hypothetical protein [Lewinellaceae bacterium]